MPTLSRNLIISFVLAIAAAGALFAYTSHVRKSAESSVDTVKVIVATHEVPVGTTVDQTRGRRGTCATSPCASRTSQTAPSPASRR